MRTYDSNYHLATELKKAVVVSSRRPVNRVSSSLATVLFYSITTLESLLIGDLRLTLDD